MATNKYVKTLEANKYRLFNMSPEIISGVVIYKIHKDY